MIKIEEQVRLEEVISDLKSLLCHAIYPMTRRKINDVIWELQSQLQEVRYRIEAKLDTIKINEVDVEIPYAMTNMDNLTPMYHGGVLYYIDKSGKLKDDGSYSWYHFAWIKHNENKFTKLVLKTMGGDAYGERLYADTYHYRHPADYAHYNSRRLASSKSYQAYIDFILSQLDRPKDENRDE